MLVIIRVDPMGRQNLIIGLEELVCWKTVLFWQLIEALLGRGDNFADNPDI